MALRRQALAMLVPGLGFALIYLILSLLLYSLSSARVFPALTNFFIPGLVKYPGKFLAGQIIIFMFGFAALACLSGAVSAQRGTVGGGIAAVLRPRLYWPQLVWALLLGGFLLSLEGTLQLVLMPLRGMLDRESPVQQIGYWLGLLLPLSGAAACLRLLFGTRRHAADRALGLVLAAVAFYQLAWSLVGLTGFQDALMMTPPGQGTKWSLGLLLAVTVGLAYKAVAAWTGLWLARRHVFVARADRRDGALVSYLILSAVFAWRGYDALDLPFHGTNTPLPIVLGYAALTGVFALASFAALVQAAALWAEPETPEAPAAAPGASVPPETAPQTAVEPASDAVAALRLPRFGVRLWIDTGIGLVVAAGLMGASFLYIGRIPVLAMPFLIPLIYGGFFIGPVLVFVFGAVRGRWGYALGAVLVVAGLFGYRGFNLMLAKEHRQATVAKAQDLTLYPFAKPKQPHDLVAMVDTYGYEQSQSGGCADNCRWILYASGKRFAEANRDGTQWRTFRLEQGAETCAAPDRLAGYLAYLADGVPGVCYSFSDGAPATEALLIRTNQSPEAPLNTLLPKGFRGTAWEFVERSGGTDTVLGRVIWGGASAPLFSQQQDISTTPPLDEAGFYQAALGLREKALPPVTARNAEAAQAALFALMRAPGGSFDTVFNAYVHLLGTTQEPAATEVLRAGILSLLNSGAPEEQRLGLRSVFAFRKHDISFAQDAIVRLMGSPVPEVARSAIGCLYSLEPPEVAFAQEALGKVVTGEGLAQYRDDVRMLTDEMKKIRGAYPEDQRAAAEALLVHRSDLTEGEMQVLLSVFAHGTEKEAAEAAALVLALPEPKYQQAVAATALTLELMTGDFMRSTIWSDADVDEIVRRADQVPNARLVAYIQAVHFHQHFRDVQGAVKDLLDKRIAALGASDSDKKTARDLQRVRDDLK